MFIPYDTRIWEVFNNKQEFLGTYLYGDMVIQFNNSITCIEGAYNWLKANNYTYNFIGDIYPLEEDSTNPLVQEIKLKWRKKERKRENKERNKKGYKLDSIIKFGKYKGQNKTIEFIIKNDNSYWKWLVKNNVILLHSELDTYL